MSTPTELRENRAAFIAEILIGLDRARAILDAADARADELAARMDAQLGPVEAMTDTRKSAHDDLDRLAAELVEDIMETSDEDILAEAKEEFGDPEAVASATRALFEKARTREGR